MTEHFLLVKFFRFLLFAAVGCMFCGHQTALAAEIVPYGDGELALTNPVGFVDSAAISPELFERTAEQAGLDGVLLKVYLPDNMAQYYADGRADAITRQVVLYGVKNGSGLDRKALELMARSLEGFYADFSSIPEELGRNREAQTEAVAEALNNGQSLLIGTQNGDNYLGHVSLVSLPMNGDSLSSAMCTCLVLTGNSIVMVTASSIVRSGSLQDDLDWVRNSADAFAEMLAP